MINLKMKYILYKQRKCIEAIRFVTQSDNQRLELLSNYYELVNLTKVRTVK